MPPCATKAQEGCQEAWPSPASALYGRQRNNLLAGFERAARHPPNASVQLQLATKAEAACHQSPRRVPRSPAKLQKGAKKAGIGRLRPCASNVIFLAGFVLPTTSQDGS